MKLTQEQKYAIYEEIEAEHREQRGNIGAWGICIIAPLWFICIIFGIDWSKAYAERDFGILFPCILMGGFFILALKTLYEGK